MIKKYLGLTLVTASLLFMGCSSDDDDDDGGGPVAPEPAAAADPYTPPEGVTDNIVATLQADPRFSVLVEAVVAAGLDGNLSADLSDEQPGLTVFAPTNEALAAAGVTSDTIADGSAGGDLAGLTNILLYHVASGAYTAQQLADNTGRLLTMLNEQTALIDGGLQGATTDGATTDGATTDGATTDGATTDGATTDGATTDGATTDGATTDGATTDGATTDGATTDGATTDGATTDGGAAPASDETPVLDETPTDGGAVSEEVPAEGGDTSGEAGVLSKAADDPLSVDGVQVTEADIFATNGVIHVVEAILTPEPPTDGGGTDGGETPTGNNLFDVIGQDANLTTLSELLVGTQLNLTLNDPANTFTVFAPDNAAFDGLEEGTVDALRADPDAAQPILLYHVSQGESDSAALIALDGGELAMSNGQNASIAVVDGNVTIDGVTVTQADIQADNGVVHIINGVLQPASNEPPADPAAEDTGAVEGAVDEAQEQLDEAL